jgi:DNA-binding CsgD family transcriptional regulator
LVSQSRVGSGRSAIGGNRNNDRKRQSLPHGHEIVGIVRPLVRELREFAGLRSPSRGEVDLPIRKGRGDRYGTRKPSRRQLRVIELVAQGLNNREIAEQLGIRQYVVRNYLSKIYDKIGVSNRVELALWYEARRHEGGSLL